MSKDLSVQKDKELLQEILSREEFRVYQGQGQNLLEKWMNQFFEWLASMFDLPDLPASSGSMVSYAIIILALAALLWLIIWLARRTIRVYQGNRAILLPGDEAASYADYLQQARQQGELGQWNEGVRFAFLALLFYLQEREWIRVEKWKTNWEYQDELRERNPSWAPFFQTQAQLFERVWYGRRRVDEVSFHRYIEELERKLQGEERERNERAT